MGRIAPAALRSGRLQPKRADAGTWTALNPVLEQGELAYEIGTGLSKTGDGETPWVDLQYDGSQSDALLVPLTQKGAAGGVATLDGSAKIPIAQLPAVATGETYTAASQAAMLALAAQTGDVAIRSDTGERFLLAGAPGTLGDWIQITDNVVLTDLQARMLTVESRRVQDEGSSLPLRRYLNFTGAGVTATDDAGNDQTDVAIPGAAGGDVVGPASSVNGNLPTFSGTGGKTLVDSGTPLATLLGVTPTRAQRIAEICRPTKYVATFYVNPDGSGTHTTIAAAVAAAATAKGTTGTVTSATTFYGSSYHPDKMVRIIVAPGTYAEQVVLQPFTHLIGSTGNPDDVVITSTAFKGALSNCSSCMVEHITAHHTGIYYGFHYGSGLVSVFHNCKFISDVASGEILGMDGSSGSLGLFLGCAFTTTTSAIKMNLHGALTNTLPVTVAFVDCTHPVGLKYDDLVSNQADRVIVLGGSMPTVELKGANVIGIVDDAAVTTVSLLSGAHVQHGKVVPAAPVGFLRVEDRDYYYPVGPAIGATRINAPADAAWASPTAARTYYIPLQVLRFCGAIYGELAVQTAAGNAVVGLASNDTTNKPGVMFANSGAVALATGKKQLGLGFVSYLYPGNGMVWAAIQYSDASAVVAMSALLSSMTQLYYQDGTIPARNAACTPVALPAGTAAPLVALI